MLVDESDDYSIVAIMLFDARGMLHTPALTSPFYHIIFIHDGHQIVDSYQGEGGLASPYSLSHFAWISIPVMA